MYMGSGATPSTGCRQSGSKFQLSRIIPKGFIGCLLTRRKISQPGLFLRERIDLFRARGTAKRLGDSFSNIRERNRDASHHPQSEPRIVICKLPEIHFAFCSLTLSIIGSRNSKEGYTRLCHVVEN
jgi:hypothetical protein